MSSSSLPVSFRFAAVQRLHNYSPNHITNDLAIIRATGSALEAQGHSVIWFQEEDRLECADFDLVFSLAQGPGGVRLLMESLGRGGGCVVNKPEGVLNCYRYNMAPALIAAGIPFPRSIIVETSDDPRIDGVIPGGKFWIKRGDVHALHREDVALAYSHAEVRSLLGEFRHRGIEKAVIQEHLAGDTVKFYAVKGTDYFAWYWLNGTEHTPFDAHRLTNLALACAETLELDIFGGDAIIGSDGSITIIDINGWPSFAPVREAAAVHIADLLIRKAAEHAARGGARTQADRGIEAENA